MCISNMIYYCHHYQHYYYCYCSLVSLFALLVYITFLRFNITIAKIDLYCSHSIVALYSRHIWLYGWVVCSTFLLFCFLVTFTTKATCRSFYKTSQIHLIYTEFPAPMLFFCLFLFVFFCFVYFMCVFFWWQYCMCLGQKGI